MGLLQPRYIAVSSEFVVHADYYAVHREIGPIVINVANRRIASARLVADFRPKVEMLILDFEANRAGNEVFEATAQGPAFERVRAVRDVAWLGRCLSRFTVKEGPTTLCVNKGRTESQANAPGNIAIETCLKSKVLMEWRRRRRDEPTAIRINEPEIALHAHYDFIELKIVARGSSTDETVRFPAEWARRYAVGDIVGNLIYSS